MPHRKPVILLVEDNEEAVQALGDALVRARGETFVIEVVTDPFDVLKRSKTHKEPALILIDGARGLDLMAMLVDDVDVSAEVHIYTDSPRAGSSDLDRRDLAGSVLPVVLEALSPKKRTPESNWRHIEIGKDADAKHARAFVAVHADMADLRTLVTEYVAASRSAWPTSVKLALIGLGCLTVVSLLFAFLARDMVISQLQGEYQNLKVNVNSSDIQATPLDARIESDGTDWDLDSLEVHPVP